MSKRKFETDDRYTRDDRIKLKFEHNVTNDFMVDVKVERQNKYDKKQKYRDKDRRKAGFWD